MRSAETLRICCWSGPRNLSTALMYSFAQRPDTQVVDEPLYAHFLHRSGPHPPGRHPGRQEILEAQEKDGEKVVRDLILGPCEQPVLFVKMMTHHLLDIDRAFLAQTRHIFLVRDPAAVLRSLARLTMDLGLGDTGLVEQRRLFEEVREQGQNPPVVDARELQLDPPGVLRQLCERLGLAFDEGMMSWPAGGRPEDGVWAPHWYEKAHRSTHFKPYRPNSEPLPPALEPLLEQCLPHHEFLFQHRLRARADRRAQVPLEAG